MTDAARVVVVDDDRAIRWVLERALAQPDLEVETFERADRALERLLEAPPEVLVTDIRMPGLDGLDLMARVREAHPELPVIVMTAHSDLDSAVASYQGGAFSTCPSPSTSTRRSPWCAGPWPTPASASARSACPRGWMPRSSARRRRCRRCSGPSAGSPTRTSRC